MPEVSFEGVSVDSSKFENKDKSAVASGRYAAEVKVTVVDAVKTTIDGGGMVETMMSGKRCSIVIMVDGKATTGGVGGMLTMAMVVDSEVKNGAAYATDGASSLVLQVRVYSMIGKGVL